MYRQIWRCPCERSESQLGKAELKKQIKALKLRMPQDVQDKLAKTAQKMWDEEAKRSDKVAEVVEKLKGFLSDLGYL